MATMDSKSNLIASISAQMHAKFPTENGNLDTFIDHFFKRVPIDFLQKMQIDALVMIVQEVWKLFQQRQPQESLVKVITSGKAGGLKEPLKAVT